jgi:hypothetical protein
MMCKSCFGRKKKCVNISIHPSSIQKSTNQRTHTNANLYRNTNTTYPNHVRSVSPRERERERDWTESLESVVLLGVIHFRGRS